MQERTITSQGAIARLEQLLISMRLEEALRAGTSELCVAEISVTRVTL